MDNTQHQSLAPHELSVLPSLGGGGDGGWPPPDPTDLRGVGHDVARSDKGTTSRRGRWLRFAAGATMAGCIALMLVIVVAAVVPSKWFVEATNRRLDEEQPAPFARVPAAASSVDDIIRFGDVDGQAELYSDDGDFYYVTISMPSQTALSWWVSEGDPTVTFITSEDKYGFATPSQRQTLSLQMMTTSEQIAQYVAFNRLGLDAELRLGEVVVAELLCEEVSETPGECAKWPPSDELIDPGDTVVSADGEDIDDLSDLSDALGQHKPGDVVDITVRRDDEELSGEVELISSPEEPDRALIGFVPFDTTTVELPFELDFDTQNTGGPSAGLAFSLALTDELSEGKLTGGANIAVTGTIAIDGRVGAIGGLVQKASAVQQAGITTFIVPAAQRPEDIEAARQVADGVDVIPVETYDEALEVLESLGGDPLPPRDDPAEDS